LFVDPEGGNFILKTGSPAIGAGAGTLPGDLDFGNHPRPSNNERWDMGAFQYSG